VAPNVRADILEATEESFDRLVNINVKGPYFLTQLAARLMIDQVKSANDGQRPKIVIISSISAYAASINRGDYCMTKAALSMMTPLFATRLAEFGINVYEIRPGIIATDMTSAVKDKYDALIQNGLTPIRRWGSPDDVAKAVAFYPGCRTPDEGGRWHARLPLMILIGADDDWTPAAPCQDLAESAKAAGEPVSIVVYPGAYHDFDHPDLPVHTVKGLAYTAGNTGVAHTGTNPAARKEALSRVIEFLTR
jgi:pimeloyl-ACP methyl ester carboxylesterase